MTIFTIDRSTCRCGGDRPSKHGRGKTLLLNRAGFMCCLGQISLQLGASREQILDSPGPRAASEKGASIELLFAAGETTNLANDAMGINDDSYSKPKREQHLETLFKGAGHEIQFVGEYNE